MNNFNKKKGNSSMRKLTILLVAAVLFLSGCSGPMVDTLTTINTIHTMYTIVTL